MNKLTLLAFLLITAVVVINMTFEDEKAGAVVGELAPEFEVADAYGNIHSISDYEGQYIILEWLNHDCPFVRKHYDGGNMQRLQEKYTEEGVIWLSVISSVPGTQGYLEPDEARAITQEKNASPTAVLLDTDSEMGRAYDARVTPHMYIISPDGTLLYNGAIDDKPTARPRDLDGAFNYIEAAMASAVNGEEIEIKTNTPYGCTVKYE